MKRKQYQFIRMAVLAYPQLLMGASDALAYRSKNLAWDRSGEGPSADDAYWCGVQHALYSVGRSVGSMVTDINRDPEETIRRLVQMWNREDTQEILEKSPLDYHKMLEYLCKMADVSVADVFGSTRKQEVVAVRRQFAAYLRQRGYSLKEVGAILGRHHATIINYVNS